MYSTPFPDVIVEGRIMRTMNFNRFQHRIKPGKPSFNSQGGAIVGYE